MFDPSVAVWKKSEACTEACTVLQPLKSWVGPEYKEHSDKCYLMVEYFYQNVFVDLGGRGVSLN